MFNVTLCQNISFTWMTHSLGSPFQQTHSLEWPICLNDPFTWRPLSTDPFSWMIKLPFQLNDPFTWMTHLLEWPIHLKASFSRPIHLNDPICLNDPFTWRPLSADPFSWMIKWPILLNNPFTQMTHSLEWPSAEVKCLSTSAIKTILSEATKLQMLQVKCSFTTAVHGAVQHHGFHQSFIWLVLAFKLPVCCLTHLLYASSGLICQEWDTQLTLGSPKYDWFPYT